MIRLWLYVTRYHIIALLGPESHQHISTSLTCFTPHMKKKLYTRVVILLQIIIYRIEMSEEDMKNKIGVCW